MTLINGGAVKPWNGCAVRICASLRRQMARAFSRGLMGAGMRSIAHARSVPAHQEPRKDRAFNGKWVGRHVSHCASRGDLDSSQAARRDSAEMAGFFSRF
jgi:hypothetical protein